jgi:hypothetical protein
LGAEAETDLARAGAGGRTGVRRSENGPLAVFLAAPGLSDKVRSGLDVVMPESSHANAQAHVFSRAADAA